MKEKLVNIGKNLFPSDKSKGFFLFLAFFCWEGLFDLLCSAQIMKTKKLLDDAALESNERKIYVFFFLFIFLTFLAMSSNNEKIGIRLLKTVTSVFPFFFMLVVTYRVSNISFYEVEAGKFEMSKVILPLLLCFVLFLLLTFSLFSAVADLQTGLQKRGLLYNLLTIIRHPLVWIGWSFLLAQVMIIPQLLTMPISAYLIPNIQNIFHLLIIYAGIAVIETAIALFVIRRMQKRLIKWSQKKPAEQTGAAAKGVYLLGCFSPVYLIISVVFIVAFIVSLVTIPDHEEETGEETVYAAIDDLVQEAYNAMYAGQLEDALAFSKAANTRLDGYLHYLRGEKEELKSLYEANRDEPVIAWLYYNQTKDLDSIEQYVITEDPDRKSVV